MAGRSDVNYTTLYTFTRIDGICIGSMLALLMRSRPELIGRYFAIIVMGLAGLNYVFYFVNQAAGSQYPYFAFVGYTTFCALFALLVHELVKGTSPLLDRMFRMPPLRYLGKISYGFYVFHWPVYVLTRPPLNQWLQSDLVLSPKQSELAVAVVSTTLALLLSILSYHTYERYFLTMKERYARS
jgi:peptidoglycan/LPS O-acetylase OafA/YrhL